MRSKRVIEDRDASGTYTLLEQRETYTDDFGSETDAKAEEYYRLGEKF